MIVIVPTRKRPHNIAALIEACSETIRHPHTVIHVVVDGEDDPDLEAEYRGVAQSSNAGFLGMSVRPRRRLGPTLNITSALFLGSTDIIGFMGDDHRPRTVGWDVKLREALEGQRDGIAYCNDLVQGSELPTAVFMKTGLIHRLGYMVPPTITHLYVDNFWKILGQRLGTLTYLDDVIIEHCHPSAGTAPSDASYAESNSQERYDTDEAAYLTYVGSELDLAVASVLRGTVRP